jgi:hypothetical protein
VPFEGFIESIVGVVALAKVMRAFASVSQALAISGKPSNG